MMFDVLLMEIIADAAVLRGKFVSFSKFGDKSADGATIKLSQSDKWFKQAGVIAAKGGVSTTDTAIAFKKISKYEPSSASVKKDSFARLNSVYFY